MKQLNIFQESGLQEPFSFIVDDAVMPEEIEYKEFKDPNQLDIFNEDKE
jgi:hypothetical protein